MTHFAVMVLIITLFFGGMSVDSTNAWRVRSQLQTAADATAHAAVIELQKAGSSDVDTNAQNTIRAAVIDLANANLMGDNQNSAITAANITFGIWDFDAGTFTQSTSNVNAVRVVANRNAASGNALGTMLLRIGGMQSWNIQTESIAAMTEGGCVAANIATNGEFEITSNNAVYNDFCIFGANGVKLSNNNTFSNDAALVVPDFSMISWPSSVGMSSVVGRGTAESSATLTYGDVFETGTGLTPTIPSAATMAASFLNPYYADQPSYINPSASVITIRAKDVKYTNFQAGRIYEVECGGSNGSKAQFFAGSTVSEVVIVSECNMQFGNGSVFEDVVLVSTDTGNKSVYGANGVRLGTDDGCATGGEVVIYAGGDFDSASGLELYGATIYAEGEMHISAQSNGIEGLNLYANGDIKFSAQASLGLCPNGLNSTETSFRLVR
ncbi:MAG: hypothetical protein K8F59_17325 [Rhodobacteraceae bacterium]|nr:hypothetical protein [Paracoccaceae bacterium]